MIATLADLIAPISLREFVESFREKRRLYNPASNPTRCEPLLPWPEIDRLLSVQANDEKLIVKRDDFVIPKRLYISTKSAAFNPRAFHDLLSQGVSLVVNDIGYAVPQIGQLAVAIERELGVMTWVNLYLSFTKGGAFKPHWDAHDVLIVQVHGHKHWRIWDPEIPSPIETSDRKLNPDLQPALEIDLRPGDVLFIPRGEPHAAAVTNGRSVHLTIGLDSLTALDLLDHLRKQAAEDPFLRTNLPRHASESENRAHEACIKSRLHQLVNSLDMEQFLDQKDVERRPHLQTAVSGVLPQMDDELRLTLRRRIPLPDMLPGDDPQTIPLGGDRYRLTPASVAVVRWLFGHDPSTRRELEAALSPTYEGASIEAALTELSRFGFLAIKRVAM